MTFLIGTSRQNIQMCFTLGFCLYSLIPALRLFSAAHLTNETLGEVNLTKHKLYEMEAVAKETGNDK